MKNSLSANTITSTILFILLSIVSVNKTQAWYEHPLLTYPVVSGMSEVTSSKPILVESLDSFLIAEEKGLMEMLASEEEWMRENLPNYAKRPDAIAFKATGDRGDIVLRFATAIRINPNSKLALYLQLPPGIDTEGRPRLKPKDIATYKDTSYLDNSMIVKLDKGEVVSPLEVVVTACDEPDHGMDIGLFEDNNTEYGKASGFGTQPFGNPNLEYSPQAPFHMGFYHESSIIFAMGSFLKKTYPEYRIRMYKRLSEFAFKTGHDYWGWRFMGWGLHYIGDLTVSYHSTVLPGISTFSMLRTNLQSMIGFPSAKNNAIQLVSNRHTGYEKFIYLIVEKAYEENKMDHPLLSALRTTATKMEYNDKLPRDYLARQSNELAGEVDEVLEKWMPEKLVSDPTFEISGSEELEAIVEETRKHKGEEAVNKITQATVKLMELYSIGTRSYVLGIIKK